MRVSNGRRGARARLAFGLWLLLVGTTVGQTEIPALPPEARIRISELRERIRQHRYTAQYSTAGALAAEIHELRKTHQGESWWETRDAARARDHLVRIAALPEEAQQELAASEKTDVEAFRLHQERRFEETIALLDARVRVSRKYLGDTQEAADLLQGLASVYRNAGRLGDAYEAARSVLSILESCVNANHPSLLNAAGNLGSDARELGRLRDAAPYLKRAYQETQRVLGSGHPKVRAAADNYAMFLIQSGQFVEAETLARESVRIALEEFGSDDDSTVRARTVLATVLQARGKLQEAEPLVRVTFESSSELLGWQHPSTLTIATQLGLLLGDLGRFPEAWELLSRVCRVRQEGEDALRAELSDATRRVGLVLARWGRLGEASTELARAEALADRDRDVDAALRAGIPLVEVAIRLGRLDLAARVSTANRRRSEQLPPSHPLALAAKGAEVSLLAARPRYAEALPIARASLAVARQLASQPLSTRPLVDLGRLLAAKGDFEEASDLLHEALDIGEDSRTRPDPVDAPRRSPFLRDVAVEAAVASVSAGRPDRAIETLERGRARGHLDLWLRTERVDPEIAKLQAAEERCRFDLNDAVAQLHVRDGRPDSKVDVLARLRETRAKASAALVAAERATLDRLRAVRPWGRAATEREVRSTLHADEHLFMFGTSPTAIVLLSIPPAGRGVVKGWVLARGAEVEAWQEPVRSARENLAAASATGPTSVDLLEHVVPAPAREHAGEAKCWFVVPDGPLVDVPLLGIPAASDPEIAILPSATSLRELRGRTVEGESGPLLVFGEVISNPVARDPVPPPGIVVRRVQGDSSASLAGLRVGDVVTSYAQKQIQSLDDFDVAIRQVSRDLAAGAIGADAQLELSYWRDGQSHRTSIRSGRLGVRFDPGSSEQALSTLRRRGKSLEQLRGEARFKDCLLAHSDGLASPPHPRVVEQIAKVFDDSGSVRSLRGEHATIAGLAVHSAGTRVHLASPAYSGSRLRPARAHVAVTRPKSLTGDDFGFLTLDRCISRPEGSLRFGSLVVLSACDTRAPDERDGDLALFEGLLHAGARRVVTTLWRTDEASAAIFFREFHRVLETDPSAEVASALRAAREKTRSISSDDVCRQLGLTPEQLRECCPRLTDQELADPPFAHPHYWAGIVLIGD